MLYESSFSWGIFHFKILQFSVISLKVANVAAWTIFFVLFSGRGGGGGRCIRIVDTLSHLHCMRCRSICMELRLSIHWRRQIHVLVLGAKTTSSPRSSAPFSTDFRLEQAHARQVLVVKMALLLVLSFISQKKLFQFMPVMNSSLWEFLSLQRLFSRNDQPNVSYLLY